jgi:bifunctional DNase/RNase
VRSACHPIYDFIQSLLEALQATVTHIVLDDVTGKGLRGFIVFQRSGTKCTIPCYATDALALAVRTKVPIYVTARALAYAVRPSPSSRARMQGKT